MRKQVYLDYVLFMKELMKEADISARQVGDTKIRASYVQRNLGVCPNDCIIDRKKTLRKFRG